MGVFESRPQSMPILAHSEEGNMKVLPKDFVAMINSSIPPLTSCGANIRHAGVLLDLLILLTPVVAYTEHARRLMVKMPRLPELEP